MRLAASSPRSALLTTIGRFKGSDVDLGHASTSPALLSQLQVCRRIRAGGAVLQERFATTIQNDPLTRRIVLQHRHLKVNPDHKRSVSS